ncbi:hypothetical protein ACTXT7_013077 [Hymenolepis weldensis]
MNTEFNDQEKQVNELYLVWVGDLEKDKCLKAFHARINKEDFEPKLMILHNHRNKITVGSDKGNPFGDYELNSIVCTCMLDQKHATIIRMPDGSFRLLDHSQNGTFLNYRKLSSYVNLSHGDVICFGHPDPKGIERGTVVEPFYWDLKYKVFIGLHDDVLLEIGKAINQEDIDQRNVPLNIKIEIADLEYKKLTSYVD